MRNCRHWFPHGNCSGKIRSINKNENSEDMGIARNCAVLNLLSLWNLTTNLVNLVNFTKFIKLVKFTRNL